MLTFEHLSKNITLKEYFEIEDADDEKHEYFDGKVIFMKGAELAHNRINTNLIGEMATFLKHNNYSVFPSALRITTPSLNAYMYPDITIVRDKMDKSDDELDTCTNPSVIIEVMSESTRKRDMGYKFFYYMQIPSFKEYILVDSLSYFVMSICRQQDGSWKFKTIDKFNLSLTVQAIGLELPLTDIYNGCTFSNT